MVAEWQDLPNRTCMKSDGDLPRVKEQQYHCIQPLKEARSELRSRDSQTGISLNKGTNKLIRNLTRIFPEQTDSKIV